VRMFERHTELARNEPELVNALTYQYVSKDPSLPSALMITTTACVLGIVRSTQVYQGLPRLGRATSPDGACHVRNQDEAIASWISPSRRKGPGVWVSGAGPCE
jgi:hypothetical protein